MKYLITLIILTLSINCYSQSNRQRLEDIEDKLDMMEYEQAVRDSQRIRNQLNNYGASKSTETPLQTRLRIGQYSRIFKNENLSIYIQDSAIVNLGTKESPQIVYSFIYEFYKPMYVDNKTYFVIEGRGTMYCSQKKAYDAVGRTHALDKNLNVVARIKLEDGDTVGTLADHARKYLCR